MEQFKTSKAQREATARYEKRKYDRTSLKLPKGQLEIIKAHSVLRGFKGVNGLILHAINEFIETPMVNINDIAAVSLLAEPSDSTNLPIASNQLPKLSNPLSGGVKANFYADYDPNAPENMAEPENEWWAEIDPNAPENMAEPTDEEWAEFSKQNEPNAADEQVKPPTQETQGEIKEQDDTPELETQRIIIPDSPERQAHIERNKLAPSGSELTCPVCTTPYIKGRKKVTCGDKKCGEKIQNDKKAAERNKKKAEQAEQQKNENDSTADTTE